MLQLEAFAECTKAKGPLAPYTALKVGGPAEALVQPRSVSELSAVRRERLPSAMWYTNRQ